MKINICSSTYTKTGNQLVSLEVLAKHTNNNFYKLYISFNQETKGNRILFKATFYKFTDSGYQQIWFLDAAKEWLEVSSNILTLPNEILTSESELIDFSEKLLEALEDKDLFI